MAQNYATGRELIGPVLISFPNLHKVNDLTQKYQVDVIFDKGSSTHRGLKKLEKEAINNRWGDKPPRSLLKGIKDGDERVSKDTGDALDGYGGRLYAKLQSGRPPQVTDVDNNPIDDPMDIKGGDICVALVHAFPYSNKFNEGVLFTLHGVRKVKDGAALGAAPVNAGNEMAAYQADDMPEDGDEFLTF